MNIDDFYVDPNRVKNYQSEPKYRLVRKGHLYWVEENSLAYGYVIVGDKTEDRTEAEKVFKYHTADLEILKESKPKAL